MDLLSIDHFVLDGILNHKFERQSISYLLPSNLRRSFYSTSASSSFLSVLKIVWLAFLLTIYQIITTSKGEIYIRTFSIYITHWN